MDRKIKRRTSPNKRKAAARLRVFLAVVLLSGCIFGAYRMASSSERPNLIIDAVNYIRQTVTEKETEPEVTQAEEPVSAVFLPILEDSYPIHMPINSEYALVYDVTMNEILYAKNADERLFPASTTKILTAAVILEHVTDPDFEFVAGDELDFVQPHSSLANVSKGHVLTTEMIIDALMIQSGNDASYMAAANVGRVIAGSPSLNAEQSVDIFMRAVNGTLKKIGAEDTVFTNPDGFHDDGHYTTLLDMLKITLYAKDVPLIKESAQKIDRYCTFVSGEVVYWENSNRLINKHNDIYYMYATGLKTGMTDQAGYCVVVTAERFGHEVVCMVFGSTASDIRWNDTIALLDKAFAHIRTYE